MKKSIQKRISRVANALEKLAINVPENLTVDEGTNQEADLKEIKNLLNDAFKHLAPLQENVMRTLNKKMKELNLDFKGKDSYQKRVQESFNNITNSIMYLMAVQNGLKNVKIDSKKGKNNE